MQETVTQRWAVAPLEGVEASQDQADRRQQSAYKDQGAPLHTCQLQRSQLESRAFGGRESSEELLKPKTKRETSLSPLGTRRQPP